MDRRGFLKASVVTGAALAGFGPDFWKQAFALPVVTGAGPYGALQAADANGFQLPVGFTSRVVARSSQIPPGSAGTYAWHPAPDGGATFAATDGGWVYVSNSETGSGGVGALRFDASGNVVDAYPILRGTANNCAGGKTPWGTWLSCEETSTGTVWECDPFTPKASADSSQRRPAMGAFAHEAVAVDPIGQKLYMTEDVTGTGTSAGRFYRFTPSSYPNLLSGTLEAAARNVSVAGTSTVGEKGTLTWVTVTNLTTGYRGANSTSFNGGEGIWYDDGWMYFSTKGDNRIWALELATQQYEVIYSPTITPNIPSGSGILSGVDNVFVSPFSGDIYVAEDGGDMDLVLLSAPAVPTGNRIASRFFKLTGFGTNSEITGPAMSPDGTRMYVSAQRSTTGSSTGGITYEISGPFRNTRAVDPVVPELPLAAAAVGTAAAVAGVALAISHRQAVQVASRI